MNNLFYNLTYPLIKMLNKKIPLHFALLMTIAGIAASTLLSFRLQKIYNTEPVVDKSISYCKPSVKRLTGFSFIRPLLFAESSPCESEQLSNVKTQVDNEINNLKLSGKIISGSVYIRELIQGEWTSAGDNEKYYPGSLLKIPELITFFKMNEKNPGLLDKSITYSTPLNLPKQVIYHSKSIELGKTYTIRELLYYMIAYSDNNATMLLNQRMDVEIFSKVFTDFGIVKPDLTKNDIPISAKDFSYFMRALYNATYLSIEDSEFCTELLSHCDFVQGLVSKLPVGIPIAHKFGEAGDGVHAHFSETGIIYIKNAPYLVVVMTKGKDSKVLPSIIADISKLIFDHINT